MFSHNKRLRYTVRVDETHPGLANLMLEQFGGPQSELAAACRYFTQYLAEGDPGRRDMPIDIATEEPSHLEVIGTIVAMLNRGAGTSGGPATNGTDGDTALANDRRGPWNASPVFDYREGRPAVDGGSGGFEVPCDPEEGQALQAMKQRLASGVDSDPITGAELGSGMLAAGDGASTRQ